MTDPWEVVSESDNKTQGVDDDPWGVNEEYPFDPKEYAASFFVDMGWEPHHASGIVGNLYHESEGLQPYITEKGDSKSGFGLAQWSSSDRKRGLFDYAKSKGETVPSFQTQLEYVHNELSGPESEAGKYLRSTKTVDEAAKVFSEKYERPGKPMMSSRLKHARDIASSIFGISEAYAAEIPKQGEDPWGVVDESPIDASALNGVKDGDDDPWEVIEEIDTTKSEPFSMPTEDTLASMANAPGGALGRTVRKAPGTFAEFLTGTASQLIRMTNQAGRPEAFGFVPEEEQQILMRGNEEVAQSLSNVAARAKAGTEAISEEKPENLKGRLWDKPGLLKEPDWWIENLGDTAVSMGPTIAAALAGGKAAGGVVGGQMEGSSFYTELVSDKEDPVEPRTAALAATAYGIASGVLNSLGLESMFGGKTALKSGARSVVRKMLTGAIGEGGTEYAEEPTQAIIESLARGDTPEQAAARLADKLKNIETGVMGAVMGGGMSVVSGDRGLTTDTTPRDAGQVGGEQAKPGTTPTLDAISNIEADLGIQDEEGITPAPTPKPGEARPGFPEVTPGESIEQPSRFSRTPLESFGDIEVERDYLVALSKIDQSPEAKEYIAKRTEEMRDAAGRIAGLGLADMKAKGQENIKAAEEQAIEDQYQAARERVMKPPTVPEQEVPLEKKVEGLQPEQIFGSQESGKPVVRRPAGPSFQAVKEPETLPDVSVKREGYEQTLPVIGENEKSMLQQALDEAESFEGPQLKVVAGEQGRPEYSRMKSAAPSWYRGEGYDRNHVVGALKTALGIDIQPGQQAKPLTEKQAETVKQIIEAKRQEWKELYGEEVPVSLAPETAIPSTPSPLEAVESSRVRVLSEEDYLAQNGASRQDIGESALHKNIPQGKPRVRLLNVQSRKDAALIDRRDQLREEYAQKVASGEIRPPTRIEKLIATAKGHPDNESVKAARRILEKQDIDWEKQSSYMKQNDALKEEKPNAGKPTAATAETVPGEAAPVPPTTRRVPVDPVTRLDGERKTLTPRLGKKATDSITAQTDGFTDNQRDIEKVAELFGTDIVWFSATDPSISLLDGFVSDDRKTAFIRTDANQPLMYIVGHESLHTVQERAPKLYAELIKVLKEEDAYSQDYIESVMEAYDEAGIERPDADGLFDEFAAHIAGHEFQNPKFWKMFNERNPSLAQKIGQVVDRILDRILKYFGIHQTENIYVKDAIRVRKVLADVFGNFARTEGVSVDVEKGDVPFSIAYHGTPYVFDRFSLEHIGRGEGAQAFGWGIYFASSRGVAEYYRSKLSTSSETWFDDVWEMATAEIDAELTNLLDENPNPSKDDLKEIVVDAADFAESSVDGRGATKFASRLLHRVESLDSKKFSVEGKRLFYDGKPYTEALDDRGHLYKVDIPDDSDLLIWDKSLSEQPEKVKKIVFDKIAPMAGFAKDADVPSKTGQELYNRLASKMGGARLASRYLKEVGIPGHRYLEGQIAGGGKGGYNYVIYDEEAVKILERNKEKIASLLSEKPKQTQFAIAPKDLPTDIRKKLEGTKVVDEKTGEPLVVFRGFVKTEGETSTAGYSKTEQLDFGIHFTENPELANHYAKKTGGKVSQGYLDIKNMLDADQIVKEGTPEFDLAKKLAGNRLFLQTEEDGKKMAYLQNAIDSTSAKRAEKLIRDAGYDGVSYKAKVVERDVYGNRPIVEGKSYIVFSPDQIISALSPGGKTAPEIITRADGTKVQQKDVDQSLVDQLRKDLEERKHKALDSIKNESGRAVIIEDLANLGVRYIEQGANTLGKFNAKMKADLGNAFDKVRTFMRRAFNRAMEIYKGSAIGNEVGGVKLPGMGKPKVALSDYQNKHMAFDPAKETDISKAGLRLSFDKLYAKIFMAEYGVKRLGEVFGGKDAAERIENLVRRVRARTSIAQTSLMDGPIKVDSQGNVTRTGPGLSEILSPLKTRQEMVDYDTLRNVMRVAALNRFRGKKLLDMQSEANKMKAEIQKMRKEPGWGDTKSRQYVRAYRATVKEIKDIQYLLKTLPIQEAKDEIARIRQAYPVQTLNEWKDISDKHRKFEEDAIMKPLVEIGKMSQERYDEIKNSPESAYYASFMREMTNLDAVVWGKEKTEPLNVVVSGGKTPGSIKRLKGSTRKMLPSIEGTIANVANVTKLLETQRLYQEVVKLRDIDPDAKEIIKQVKIKPDGTPPRNSITVYKDGKTYHYQLPRWIADGIDFYQPNEVSFAWKALSFPATALRYGATMAVDFVVRNPVRDQFSAMAYSKHGYIPFVDLAKGMVNYWADSDLYKEFKAAGGEQNYFSMMDREATQIKASEIVGYRKEGVERIVQYVGSPFRFWSSLSKSLEEGTRLGEYALARKRGKSSVEAQAAARDLTLDFQRKGGDQVVRAMNMITAFWNANIQGTDKMVREFANKETRMPTLIRTFMGITLPSIILWGLFHDDDRWKELPDWRKNFFWNIPIGKDGPILSLPKPFELGLIFGSLPERILDWAFANRPDAMKSMGTAIVDGAFPGMIPTSAIPFIESWANYSFFKDAPLESRSEQQLPPGMRANQYTSETLKRIGSATDISPKKLENWARGWTGNLGKMGLDLSDKVLFPNDIPPVSKKWYEYAGARAFFAKEPTGSSGKALDRFYDNMEECTQAKNGYKVLRSQEDKTEAIKYRQEKSKEIRLAPSANDAAERLSFYRKKKIVIMGDKQISSDEKRRRIDEIDRKMSIVAERFNQRFEQKN